METKIKRRLVKYSITNFYRIPTGQLAMQEVFKYRIEVYSELEKQWIVDTYINSEYKEVPAEFVDEDIALAYFDKNPVVKEEVIAQTEI